MSSKKISQITFTHADLDWFAEQSGDWNPIHVNPVAARRLLAGDVVVHGMFTLLWALESYCEDNAAAPAKITVSFHRPVLAGESIELHLEQVSDSEARLLAYNRQEVVATIRTEGTCPTSNPGMPANETPLRTDPARLGFAQVKGLTGTVALQAIDAVVRRRFPRLVESIGLLPIAAIMASSRIVGMECPGLSSLYAGAEFEFAPNDQSTALKWQVVRHTLAQAPVRLKVCGAGIAGRLDAFVRPEPVSQPTVAQVAPQVEPGLCRGQVAWVIGGSRGLGEVVSKLVAAAGGHVVLTYHKGMQDAARVADEIVEWGGSSEIVQLDVRDPASVLDMIKAVRVPSHLYYFASSRISRPRHALFDESLLGEFIETYVNAFSRLIRAVRGSVSGPLKVFYPSTVFIDELPKEFPEYVAAKSAGETLCSYLARHLPNLEIVLKRLPRLPTDQTNGLIRVGTSDPVEHLLPVVHEMSTSLSNGNQ